jgi:8-oxo-dGTP diphosphatase
LDILRARLSKFAKPTAHAEHQGSAAVAILLKPADMAYSILLVKRRVDERDPWSGQIAFPGGRFRPEDELLIETMRRELYEEVGLHLDEDVELLGSLDPLTPSNAPMLRVIPYIGRMRGEPSIRLGPELSEYLWTPLTSLKRRVGVVFANGRKDVIAVPVYMVGSEVIWGLTANILRRMFDILEPIT